MTIPPAVEWPFLHPLVTALPRGPVTVRVTRIDEAFVNRQTANTRLVTTQASYLLQIWLDANGDRAVWKRRDQRMKEWPLDRRRNGHRASLPAQ